MFSLGTRGDSDRRADRRYKVNFRLHWGRGESDEFEGEVSELGRGGCFVESGRRWPKATSSNSASTSAAGAVSPSGGTSFTG